MALNDAALNIGANAIRGAITHVSLHTAAPNASGSNESSAGRVAVSWGTAAAGDITASDLAFTGGAASGSCTHVGFWSASSAGTFYGFLPLAGDQTFNAAGEYNITSLALNSAAA